MYHDDSSDEDAESGISQDLEPKSDISLVSTSDPNELSEVEPSNPDNTLSELEDEYGELGNSEDEIDDGKHTYNSQRSKLRLTLNVISQILVQSRIPTAAIEVLPMMRKRKRMTTRTRMTRMMMGMRMMNQPNQTNNPASRRRSLCRPSFISHIAKPQLSIILWTYLL